MVELTNDDLIALENSFEFIGSENYSLISMSMYDEEDIDDLGYLGITMSYIPIKGLDGGICFGYSRYYYENEGFIYSYADNLINQNFGKFSKLLECKLFDETVKNKLIDFFEDYLFGLKKEMIKNKLKVLESKTKGEPCFVCEKNVLLIENLVLSYERLFLYLGNGRFKIYNPFIYELSAKCRKDPTFLDLFKGNHENVKRFFVLLKSNKVNALSKNNEWIFPRKTSIVACFRALKELELIYYSDNAQLRRIIESEIKVEMGTKGMRRKDFKRDDVSLFDRFFRRNLII